jgi:hypothetical protein
VSCGLLVMRSGFQSIVVCGVLRSPPGSVPALHSSSGTSELQFCRQQSSAHMRTFKTRQVPVHHHGRSNWKGSNYGCRDVRYACSKVQLRYLRELIVLSGGDQLPATSLEWSRCFAVRFHSARGLEVGEAAAPHGPVYTPADAPRHFAQENGLTSASGPGSSLGPRRRGAVTEQ